MTNFDEMSAGFPVVTFILGFLSVIIVGSQTQEDARSVAIWTLFMFIPLFLVSCARLATSSQNDGLGMVILCSGLVVAIGVGNRVAILRERASRSDLKGNKAEPGSWDDELF